MIRAAASFSQPAPSHPGASPGKTWKVMLAASLLLLPWGSCWAFSDWVTRRDQGVVRQALDYSCGVAALATYLTHYLRQPVTERELLELLVARSEQWQLPDDWQQQGVSWQILQQLAGQFDLQAAALSLPADLVLSLQVPALVRLVVRGQAHFSLLRGVDEAGRVQLADPSWGNQVLSREAFLSLWALDGGRGSIMLFQPAAGSPMAIDPGYFGVDSLPVRIRPTAG